MLTASKDCNLDWKVKYAQYSNITKDDMDVLFILDTVPYAEFTKNKNTLISILKKFSMKVSSLEFM